jgi:hypothetical protein
MSTEITVPDIGDFDSVEIIEIRLAMLLSKTTQ